MRYRFVDEREAAGVFRVDESTGDLYLLRALDYERGSLYELEVEAYDKGSGAPDSLSSVCAVRVEVLDTNDNAPVVSWPNDGHMPLVMRVDGGASLAELAVTLNVTDEDSDVFGALRFKLERQLKLEQV